MGAAQSIGFLSNAVEQLDIPYADYHFDQGSTNSRGKTPNDINYLHVYWQHSSLALSSGCVSKSASLHFPFQAQI